MNTKYFEYVSGESQYEDIDLTKQKVVEARYVPALVDADAGNPFIEALPYPRNDKAVMNDYTKPLPGYKFEDVEKMSKLKKMMQIGTLRELRFALPHHKELEFMMYNCLVNSYRARRQMDGENAELTYVSDNQEQDTSSILVGESRCSTAANFYMTGHSGSGKSSAIEILTDHYPQVIIHTGEDKRFPQITYLIVNAVANSNFDALYEGIGDAIDKALGNVKPVYAKIISNIKGLGKKQKKVRELIELFAVGIIIFDEIQLIDFSHTKENTFDSLLTLENETKASMVLVGTEEAERKMNFELRTARRVGARINADRYCEDKKFFAMLVKNLFHYQWFGTKEPVKVTDEIIDALYEVTKGIIDQLIGVYQFANMEAVIRKRTPQINGDYFRMIANKYYPGMQEVLSETIVSEEKRNKILDNADIKYQTMIDQAKQEEEKERLMDENEESVKRRIKLENVTSLITGIYPEYKPADIKRAFQSVMNKKDADKLTDQKVAHDVITKLQAGPKPKKKSNGPVLTEEEMKDFLDREA